MPARLGEILVKDGACSEAALREALENQVIFGGRLGTNLLEIQGVSEDALARALGRQHALPALSGDVRLAPEATALLTPEIADRYDAVPYLVVDRRLALLVVDPRNLAMLDEVAFATGKQVQPIVVPEARVWTLLRRVYGIERNLRGIDVDFATLGARGSPSPAHAAAEDRVSPSPTRAAGGEGRGEGGSAAGAHISPAPTRAAAGEHISPSPSRAAGGEGRGEGGVPAGGDLMTESDFSALYERPAASDFLCAADEVIELTDLLLEPEPAGAAPPPSAPEVLAALARGSGYAPPTARLPVPPAPAAEPEPSPLSFAEAVRFLEGVDERNAIAKTVLRYARSRFGRALLLTVQRGGAHGWAGLGERLGPEGVRRMHVALGTPGILDMVVRTRAHFLGPIPKTEANIRLLKALGGGVPANALVVPILARGRVVNLFYADNGRGGVLDSGGVGELLILATRIAKSYDTLLARVR